MARWLELPARSAVGGGAIGRARTTRLHRCDAQRITAGAVDGMLTTIRLEQEGVKLARPVR